MKVTCLDNFEEFHCKCGECRNTCCEYWHITMSQKEYFRLLNTECSPELKEKLNNAFAILSEPSVDRYAEMKLNYFGRCPLLSKEGMCSLQCECGEKALTKVCINYPRCNRFIGGQEIGLSCSCEKVLEMCFRDSYLHLVSREMEDHFASMEVDDDKKINEAAIRSRCIACFQNDHPVKENIADLKEYLESLAGKKFVSLPQREQLLKTIQEELFRTDYDDMDELFHPYVPENEVDETIQEILNHHPDLRTAVKNIFITHLFYANYPFVESLEDMETSFDGLLVIYEYMKHILFLYPEDKDRFVDSLSYLFRQVEHSPFYYNTRVIIENLRK